MSARYLELAPLEEDEETEGRLSRFRLAYRTAFDVANDDIKKRVAKNYVRILREESGFEVLTWEQAFFQASDLAYMTPADAEVAKKHLLPQLNTEMTPEMRATLTGIGKHASEEELSTLVDHYVRSVFSRDSPQRRKIAEGLLQRLWNEAPVGPDKVIRARLGDWQRLMTERERPELQEWLQDQTHLLVDLEDLPF